MTEQQLKELVSYISPSTEDLKIDETIAALTNTISINQRIENIEKKEEMILSALNDLHESIVEMNCEIRNLKNEIR